MKVEILEKRLSSLDHETGRHYALEEGDRVTVSDATGKAWCAAGWAKDVAGKVETGQRVVKGNVVEPKNATHKNKSKKVGG